MIGSKSHKSINVFLGAEHKIVVLATFYFIGFFLFLKTDILCNVRTKGVHETYFKLKVRTDSIPNSAYF